MRATKPMIGLCGGIGSGKSFVAHEFGQLGCLVIDSDQLNREVMARPEVVAELRRWWGPDVELPSGGVDRKRVAAIVFADEAEKRRLEGLLHPLIARTRADMISAVEDRSPVRAIVIDSPLLIEANLDRDCDVIVFVEASEDVRLARLRQSRGWDAEELKRRERWQLSQREKRARADFVVDNDGPREQVRPQVVGILDRIAARPSP